MTGKYNPISNPIKITCKAADLIQIDLLKKFQGNLKTLSDSNREKMVKDEYRMAFTNNGQRYVISSRHGTLEDALNKDEGVQDFMAGSKMVQEIINFYYGNCFNFQFMV